MKSEQPTPKPTPQQKSHVNKKLIPAQGMSVTFLRAMFTNAINFILVVLTFFVLGKLPDLSKKIQDARNVNSVAQSTSVIGARIAELEQEASKIKVIKESFSNENKLLNFVREIDSLRVEGTITDFAFLNNSPVVDKTKNPGLPISIELKGSKDQVNSALNKLLLGGYLIRAIDFDLNVSTENVINLKYGGFLYVSEDIN